MKIDELKRTIEHVGTGIPPDGDWLPMLIAEKDIGGEKPSTTIIPMPGSTDDEATRMIAALAITGTLRTLKATAAVWITTAWTVRLDHATDAEKRDVMNLARQHKLMQHHAKIECVVAMVAARHAPMIGLTGRIIRSRDNHPKIEWMKDWDENGSAHFGGRFPEALREGVNW